MNVGFIGLGAMGQGMAANLLAAGHTVRVWNRSSEPAERLKAQGAIAVPTAAEAFQGDAVVTMLADDGSIRSVVLDGGLLAKSQPRLVHIVMSTISAEFAHDLAHAHREHGVSYVSAPVFGRPDVAAAGKLTIVVGGAPEAIDRVSPVLAAMGQRAWRIGDDPVAANVVKIAGNFLLICAVEAMGEAVALAKGHHVDPAAMLEIFTETLFAAPVYKTYGTLIVNERYRPAGFKLALGFKDLKLALAAAESSHTPLPFAGVARDAFIEAIAHGNADADLSALASVAAERAGAVR